MIKCPECNSDRFYQLEVNQYRDLPDQNLLLPVGFPKFVYVCADCGYKLKR